MKQSQNLAQTNRSSITLLMTIQNCFELEMALLFSSLVVYVTVLKYLV